MNDNLPRTHRLALPGDVWSGGGILVKHPGEGWRRYSFDTLLSVETGGDVLFALPKPRYTCPLEFSRYV